MKRFAQLYDDIDRTTSTNAKVAAIAVYLAEVPPADAAWALFFPHRPPLEASFADEADA
jgi:DNA ligase 1